jgi:hypothetical protein
LSSYQPKSKPGDFKHVVAHVISTNLHYERLLDGVPAGLIFCGLLFSLTGAIFVPRLIIYMAGLLVMYVALRLLLVGRAFLNGQRYIRLAESVNWRLLYDQAARADALPWEAIRHIVIVPNYQETETLLNHSLSKLAALPAAREQIVVILAMEGAEDDSRQKGERLKAVFAERFAGCFVTIHPRGLPGEHQCKSANLNWAGRWVMRELVEARGWDKDLLTISTMDADTVWHPNYFEALTYYFATDPLRYQRFWQAPIQYYIGLYESPPLLRPMNAYATSMELAYLSAPWHLSMPISSYSTSLHLLQSSGFWDVDVIADEQHMFLKAFFAQGGMASLMPIYLPFQVSAVGAANFWQTAKLRYTQTVRHAWSSKEIGYLIDKILKTQHVPRRRVFWLFWSISHDLVVSGAGWVAVTLSTQLPVLLHPALRAEYFNRGLIYPQTLLLEAAGIVMVLVTMAFLIVDFRVRPRPSMPLPRTDRLLELVGILLLPAYALIFVTLPLLQAQIMLLFGKSLVFKVTPKAS